MKKSVILGLAAGGLLVTAAIAAIGASDDFEGGTNSAGWHFNGFSTDILESSGGNPGWWLHNSNIFANAPIVSTAAGAPSPWLGDYRALGVTRISLDARTDAPAGMCCRDMSLLLRNEMGTPGSTADDKVAFYVGPPIPAQGAGWVHYDFDIPSADTNPSPTGWEGDNWNDVVTNVDVVEIWWMDPQNFSITQTWDAGVDNIVLEVAGLVLSAPSPGIAGQVNTMDVSLAQPFSTVGLGASLRTGTTSLACGGGTVSLDLQSPTRLDLVNADANGDATFSFFAPNAVSGRTAHFQALDLGDCETSSVVTFTFP